MKEHKHIPEEAFHKFRWNLMDAQEKVEFLEHISSCDFCSDLFAEHMSKDLVTAPRELKANLMKAVRSPEIRLRKLAKQSSKRMQLLLYSLKVGTAMAGALLILLWSISFSNKQIPQTEKETQKPSISFTSAIRDNMNTLNSGLSNLSNQIMNMEVVNNEKNEK